MRPNVRSVNLMTGTYLAREHNMNLHLSSPRYGLEFDGRSFDCGSKAGFLAANVTNALERNDVAAGDADGNAWSGKLVTDPASGAKISSKCTLPQKP